MEVAARDRTWRRGGRHRAPFPSVFLRVQQKRTLHDGQENGFLNAFLLTFPTLDTIQQD